MSSWIKKGQQGNHGNHRKNPVEARQSIVMGYDLMMANLEYVSFFIFSLPLSLSLSAICCLSVCIPVDKSAAVTKAISEFKAAESINGTWTLHW
jgi:hypothetical protein